MDLAALHRIQPPGGAAAMDPAALHRIQSPGARPLWIRPSSIGSSAGWHARHGSSRIRGEGEGLRRTLMEESCNTPVLCLHLGIANHTYRASSSILFIHA